MRPTQHGTFTERRFHPLGGNLIFPIESKSSEEIRYNHVTNNPLNKICKIKVLHNLSIGLTCTSTTENIVKKTNYECIQYIQF